MHHRAFLIKKIIKFFSIAAFIVLITTAAPYFLKWSYSPLIFDIYTEDGEKTDFGKDPFGNIYIRVVCWQCTPVYWNERIHGLHVWNTNFITRSLAVSNETLYFRDFWTIKLEHTSEMSIPGIDTNTLEVIRIPTRYGTELYLKDKNGLYYFYSSSKCVYKVNDLNPPDKSILQNSPFYEPIHESVFHCRGWKRN